MRKKIMPFLLALISSITVCSQTIYHLEYNFPGTADTNRYESLLVRYNDGSGFVRSIHQPGNTSDSMLVEMKLQEQYLSNSNGDIDTSRLVYTLAPPSLIRGTISNNFTIPVFVYSHNMATGFFDPTVVSSSAVNSAASKGILIKADYISSNDLAKGFVSRFFKQDESFYKNLFGLRSRGLSETEKNTNIYLLTVANTNDSAIGGSCYKDMTRMVSVFKDIAEYLGIKIYPTSIWGKLYNKKNIQDAINDIKPGPNDIVVFYYSGHGFRKAKDKRRYPFLDFRAKPADDYKVFSMNLEDIYAMITKKGARFNLILSDCCNTDPEATNSTGMGIPEPRGSGLDWNEDNLKRLFLSQEKLSVLATAADVGQRASSNNGFGGFFSYFFKASMEDHFSSFKTDVTWDDVIQEAAKQTRFKAEHTYCDKPYIPANICKQYPFYKKGLLNN